MKKEEKKKYNPNLTEEDLKILKDKNLSMDNGDDRLLQNRKNPIDFSGEQLDVPGRKKNQQDLLTDEENSLYAQGGERNENLEQPERANSTKSES
ncbi:hypothetical protein [Euzebyella saccharophila]|uniref:Uncharacterized protein n=1 Tax=Euzebyella saccharophila TaxID=679664 RepID=A0ABV8JQ05_9FLAO|nr:hypothetical protein [Euzebyella saccharophila]